MAQQIVDVEMEKVDVNPFQPRGRFAEEELAELARSIQSVGLIHPPVVKARGSRYELVSGERRFRAAKVAGLSTIPVVVHDGTTSYSAQATLIENIQRVDLNPMEVARALSRLIEEFSFHQDELAERLGKKRSTVANFLRLLQLPKGIREAIEKEEITMGHAKAILSLEGFDKRIFLFERVVKEALSVREAEKAARELAKDTGKRRIASPLSRDCFLEDLREKLQRRLGTKVAVQGKGKKGKISIEYYNLDDLERVLELIGVE